jgi:hypothetical protein
MTKDDALRMMLGPFKAWRDVPGNEDVVEELTKIINAVEKVLAQDQALQALHDENERLGLYRDAYAEQEPVSILNHAHGVHTFRNVNLKGLPDGEYLVYIHPPQRTEQEPVEPTEKIYKAWGILVGQHKDLLEENKKLRNQSQRTWVGLTDEEQLDIFAQSVAKKRSDYEHYKAIEQSLKEKNT